MKELLRHIKALLIENECVIIPDFGGFITYYSAARYCDEKHMFLPPYRTVGFNSLLQMNDGLLIQSYMQEYEVSYPVAQKMVETAVNELCDTLNQEGYIHIPGLGELSLNVENTLNFRPEEQDITSPALYGWQAFEMKELKELHPTVTFQPTNPASTQQHKKPNTLVINVSRTWLNNIVAVAAAVILFFVLSTPVGNTYVEPESYASLGYAGLFEQICKQSLATTLMESSQTPIQQQTKTIQEEKIKLVSTPHVTSHTTNQSKATPKEQTSQSSKTVQKTVSTPATPVKQTTKKQYHIIVASVKNRKDAEKMLKELIDKGYPNATIIESDGRVRIALMSSSDKEALNTQMLQLRKKDEFKNAWMFTTRN